MKSPILDPELKAALKRLKLGYIFEVLPERLVLAEQQELSFQETMLMLLQDEITRRDNTASSRRAAKAKLDPSMLLERWDKTAKVRFDTRVLNELMTLRFIEADRNVVILGPVGVGKTFVANALGHVACRHKYDVAGELACRRAPFGPSGTKDAHNNRLAGLCSGVSGLCICQ
jgi:DNA replication protein DnaC